MPTAQEYLRPDLIAAVERLDLRARFIVEGFLSGLNRSPFHGASVEFSEHRRYRPGDEPRLIDQNVLARTDRLYIRKFQAETNLEAWLAVDCSASMNHPARSGSTGKLGRQFNKLDYAITLAAALAWLMTGQQDAIGLVAFDPNIRAWLAPRATRRHLLNLLSTLAGITPPAPRTTEPAALTAAEEGMAGALNRMAGQIHRRGLIILLSDLLADPAPVIESLRHLHHRGHDLVVMQVLDVSESRFNLSGPCRLTDPETAAYADVDADEVRAGYLAALAEHVGRYRAALADLHGDLVEIDTATPFDAALVGFLRARTSQG